MPRLFLADSPRVRYATGAVMYFAQGVPAGLMNIALPAWLVSAMRDLQPGQVSAAVRGDNGFHVFRLVLRDAPPAPPLASVRDDLYQDLLNQEMSRQERVYLRELRGRTSISVRL